MSDNLSNDEIIEILQEAFFPLDCEVRLHDRKHDLSFSVSNKSRTVLAELDPVPIRLLRDRKYLSDMISGVLLQISSKEIG